MEYEIDIKKLAPYYDLNSIPVYFEFEKKKIKRMTEDEYMKYVLSMNVNVEDKGRLLHLAEFKAQKYIYDNFLNNYERNILINYYIENASSGLYHLTVPEGVSLMMDGWQHHFFNKVTFAYVPFIKDHTDIAIRIMNQIIDYFKPDNYHLSEMYTGLANCIYKQCDKDPYHLRLVAEYGLKAYNLKNDWFDIWKTGNGMRLDYFWSTLCNVLSKIGMVDKAIEICVFASEHDAYDNTKTGWKGKLEKYKKLKSKEIKTLPLR